MEKVNSFDKDFISCQKGETSVDQAIRTRRGAESALKTHIAIKEGNTTGLEDAIEMAKEALKKARVNNGVTLSSVEDRDAYVTNLINAKNKVTLADKELKDHKELLKFLNEELKGLTKTVEA